jgi:hypothetical protein
MNHTTLQQDAEKFAAFIVNNYKDAKDWVDPVRKAAWYIGHAFVASVIDEKGDIVALVAARPVDRPGIGVLPYYFNDKGTCLHVDLLLDISEQTGNERVGMLLQVPFPAMQNDLHVPAFREQNERLLHR